MSCFTFVANYYIVIIIVIVIIIIIVVGGVICSLVSAHYTFTVIVDYYCVNYKI